MDEDVVEDLILSSDEGGGSDIGSFKGQRSDQEEPELPSPKHQTKKPKPFLELSKNKAQFRSKKRKKAN